MFNCHGFQAVDAEVLAVKSKFLNCHGFQVVEAISKDLGFSQKLKFLK